jgi:hypothetical protein
MRYVVYGDDAMSRQPREPVVIDAGSEEEARGRAVARGIAVRAVIAEPASEPTAPSTDVGPPLPEEPAESPEMRGVRLVLLYVVLPLVLTFFLALAIVRTLFEAAGWTLLWTIGLLLGGGIAGLAGWLSHGAIGAETAWPTGMAAGLIVVSAVHGWQVGWRWWWAKRSLGPLAQALGAEPEQASPEELRRLRAPVVLAQALAGGILGAILAAVGSMTGWSWPTVFAGTVGGILGLGLEGATIAYDMLRIRPMPPPGAAARPSLASLAGLLAWIWGEKHIAPSWVLGHALDRAAPGAVAGTFVGLAAFVLGWWAVAG